MLPQPGAATNKRPLKKGYMHPSGRTLSVTVLERINAEGIYQGAVHLEAKRTACSGWASSHPAICLLDPVPVPTTVQPGRFSNFWRQKFTQPAWLAMSDRLEAKKTAFLNCNITFVNTRTINL